MHPQKLHSISHCLSFKNTRNYDPITLIYPNPSIRLGILNNSKSPLPLFFMILWCCLWKTCIVLYCIMFFSPNPKDITSETSVIFGASPNISSPCLQILSRSHEGFHFVLHSVTTALSAKSFPAKEKVFILLLLTITVPQSTFSTHSTCWSLKKTGSSHECYQYYNLCCRCINVICLNL